MKILQKIVAAVCAVAVTATMTSPISIGDNSARGAEVQRVSETDETADSPTALSDEEKPMSGKCGDNLTWVLDDKGTLTIRGTGEMYNYDYYDSSPWFKFRWDVKAVLVENGVTSIGDGAFGDGAYALSGVTSVTIPPSVKKIGDGAFTSCRELTSVTIPEGVESIGEDAFRACGLTTVTLPGSVIDIDWYAFFDCSELRTVYYTGSNIQWGKINIKGFNYPLQNADIHFSSIDNEKTYDPLGEKVSFNGHTYQLIHSDNSWDEVNEYLSAEKGYLAAINTAEEDEFVYNYAKECGYTNVVFGLYKDKSDNKWKWSSGEDVTYTNWHTGEPNNENLGELYGHYYDRFGDGTWNSCSYPVGDEVYICEWENEGTIDQSVGNVHFITNYSPETGKVRFDDSSTHIGLDYTLSDIIDKELAASLVDKYVIAEVDSDSLTITDLKPVESKIGTISAIDKTASTITIDGEVYPLSRDNSVLALFADQQIGKMVLFHTYQGTVVGLSSVEEKIGTLNSWDNTNKELTIDDSVYPTNSLTDMTFVTDIEQMLERKVKFTYVNDSYTPILAVELYDENNDDHSEFEADIYHANWLTTKSTSTDILKDETPSSILQDPTSEFVNEGWNAFSKILSLPSSVSTLGEFAMGITQQDMYEALILDALQASVSYDKLANKTVKDNIKLSKQFVSDISAAVKSKYLIDMSNVEDYRKAANNTDIEKFLEGYADTWFKENEPDLASLSKPLKHFSTFLKVCGSIEDVGDYYLSCLTLAQMDKETIELLNRAYNSCVNNKDIGESHPMTKAFLECLDMYRIGKEGLWASIVSGSVKVGGKWGQEYLVDKLWSKVKETVGLKNPNVAIILAGISAGKTVTNFLCKSDSAAEKYIKMEYITHIESVFNNIYNSCVSSFKANKDLESARLFLAAVRLEFQLRDTDCETAYKYADELDQAFLSKLASWLGDTTQKNLKNKISTIQNAYKTSYWGAETLWVNYLEDDYPNSGLYEKYSYLLSDDAIKSFFNLKKEVKAACPVNVYVYDEEDHLVAYVEDGIVSCSVDDLVIVQDGDEKIIRFYGNANYRVEYSGYDEGTMDIVITEFDNDTQIARTVNYNNLPVTNSQIYSSTIDNQMFKPYRLTDNTESSDVTYDYDSMQSTSKHKLTIISGTVEQNGETLIETTAAKGERLSLTAFAPEGYTFVKWQSTGASSVIYDTLSKNTTMIMPDEDVTLTAVINPPEGTYMISFDFNNEQEEYTYRRTDTNGKLNDLPAAKRNGYTFDGWFTTADDGNKITTETVFTADTTVYAHWTKNTGDSESPSIPDTSDSSNSSDDGTDSDTTSDSGANVDSGSSANSEVSSGSSSDDTSNNSKPGDSTSGTDSDDLDTNNPSTGVTVAIVPILLAAGASVVIFRKKNRK